MEYCIIARYVADDFGGVAKDDSPLLFANEETARVWARENLNGVRYLAEWDVIPYCSGVHKRYFRDTKII